MLALRLCALALGAPGSLDIELLRPSFAPGSTPALVGPVTTEPGTLRLGMRTWYSLDPLVLQLYGYEVGAVVHHRQTLSLGLWRQATEGLGVRAQLPLVAQWGSQTPSLSGDGAGWGDPTLGASWTPVRGEHLRAGLRGDLAVPFGRKNRWMGDSGPRAELALTGALGGERLEWSAELGVGLRGPPDTRAATQGGSEWIGAAAVQAVAWPERLSVYSGISARGSLAALTAGAPRPGAEALVGARVQLRRVELDAGLGRGLTWGWGTTEARLWAGLTFTPGREGALEPELRVRELQSLPDAPVQVTERPSPEPWEPPASWAEGELARVQADQIVIRDPIQFEFGTDRILPESIPVLEAVAAEMNQHARITHLIVEGHASEEGSFVYNYELSNRRAQAVWRALIEAGVHPDRVSYRGLGEVRPVAPSEDPAALATNRRVEFRIAQQLGPADPLPTWDAQTLLPWSGELHQLVQPADPAPAVPDLPAPNLPDPDPGPEDFVPVEDL